MKVRISDHAQRTPGWFADRCGKVTGSACAAIFAKGKAKGEESSERRKYRLQLALETITGQPAGSTYMNAAMQRGIDLEAEAVAAYEAATGNMVTVPGFMFAEAEQIGASLDGLVNADGSLEVKVPDSTTHLAYIRGKRVPPEYVSQVTHNVFVSGRKWLDFVSYDPRFPEPLRLFVWRVHADDLNLSAHAEAVRGFLGEVEAEVDSIKELMK
jgi:hypothetical protein